VIRSVRGERPGEARAGALAAAIFLALALATLLALFYAQGLKRQDPLVRLSWTAVSRFRPGGPGPQEAHFDVQTSVDDLLAASIVDSAGRVVRVLGPVVAHKYRHVSFAWDGRTSAGVPAPPGTYLVRVHLQHWDQTVPLPPTKVTLRLEGPSG